MRILALDVGEKRIGVAVGDPTGTVARPLVIIHRRSWAQDLGTIRELVEEYGVELIVVGHPLTLRGEVGPQAQQVERFVARLETTLSVPVRLWDERYTTVTAEEILLRSGGRRQRRRKQDLDAVAAAVILQGFLDTRATEGG